MANIFKKAGRLVKKAFNTTGVGGALKVVSKAVGGSGKRDATEATAQAEQFANESEAERVKLAAKTKREKLRAQKLAVKGLRSKRAASYFKPEKGTTGTYGSPTIG